MEAPDDGDTMQLLIVRDLVAAQASILKATGFTPMFLARGVQSELRGAAGDQPQAG
jgi:hypothetical protein